MGELVEGWERTPEIWTSFALGHCLSQFFASLHSNTEIGRDD
jgi:hypothetical protein